MSLVLQALHHHLQQTHPQATLTPDDITITTTQFEHLSTLNRAERSETALGHPNYHLDTVITIDDGYLYLRRHTLPTPEALTNPYAMRHYSRVNINSNIYRLLLADPNTLDQLEQLLQDDHHQPQHTPRLPPNPHPSS